MAIIRHATVHDTEELELLFQLTRRATFTSRSPEEFKIGDYMESVEGEEVLVAEQDGKIVGFISLWLADNFIHNLFVHPDWQCQGIGSVLLQEAEPYLGRPIALKVAIENVRVGTFYQKHGYEYIFTHADAPEPYMLYKKW